MKDGSDMVVTSRSVDVPPRRLFLFRGMAGAAAFLCATPSGAARAEGEHSVVRVSRDVHIHVRVHVGGGVTYARYQGGHVAYTGQVFFNDGITDAVARHGPYAKHDVKRTRQDEDDVFVTQHGSGSMLAFGAAKQAFD